MRRLSWLLIFCALFPACATTKMSRDVPVVREYSRNAVVCIPTAVGNVAGGAIGLGAALPIGLASEAVGRPMFNLGRGNALLLAGEIFVIPPALLGGALLGSAFLPLAQLFDADPCSFEF